MYYFDVKFLKEMLEFRDTKQVTEKTKQNIKVKILSLIDELIFNFIIFIRVFWDFHFKLIHIL